jgi:hypothetical protein
MTDMARPRRRKIPPVSQLQYMMERGDKFTGEIKIKNTDDGRICVNIRDLCSFPDQDETFQLVRALVRVGTCQWGSEFLERIQNYVGQVKVIGGE